MLRINPEDDNKINYQCELCGRKTSSSYPANEEKISKEWEDLTRITNLTKNN